MTQPTRFFLNDVPPTRYIEKDISYVVVLNNSYSLDSLIYFFPPSSFRPSLSAKNFAFFLFSPKKIALNKTNTLKKPTYLPKIPTKKFFPTNTQLNSSNQKKYAIYKTSLNSNIYRNNDKYFRNTPNIRNALKPIRNYINEILKQTRQIEQILENMPNATHAPEIDTSFTEITPKQTKQIIEN